MHFEGKIRKFMGMTAIDRCIFGVHSESAMAANDTKEENSRQEESYQIKSDTAMSQL